VAYGGFVAVLRHLSTKEKEDVYVKILTLSNNQGKLGKRREQNQSTSSKPVHLDRIQLVLTILPFLLLEQLLLALTLRLGLRQTVLVQVLIGLYGLHTDLVLEHRFDLGELLLVLLELLRVNALKKFNVNQTLVDIEEFPLFDPLLPLQLLSFLKLFFFFAFLDLNHPLHVLSFLLFGVLLQFFFQLRSVQGALGQRKL